MDPHQDAHHAIPGAALHVKTRVLPGSRVELAAPGLPEGELVDVFVVTESRPTRAARSALEVIHSLQGHRSFASADQVDSYLDGERNAWDR